MQDAFDKWYDENCEDYVSQGYESCRDAFKAGMLHAAGIAARHTCGDCERHGTFCEDKVAEDIREEANK